MAKAKQASQAIAPLRSDRHADYTVSPVTDFTFASGMNFIPLVLGELARASREFPIVFARGENGLLPGIVSGLKTGQNLLVDGDGNWIGKYIPALLRRYPFIMSENGKNTNDRKLTLCIDTNYDGFEEHGDGERLFETDGSASSFAQEQINFLVTLDRQALQTQRFCAALEETGIIEAKKVSFSIDEKSSTSELAGIFLINREKLHSLEADTLTEWTGLGYLELAHAHLASLQNFEELGRRAAEVELV